MLANGFGGIDPVLRLLALIATLRSRSRSLLSVLQIVPKLIETLSHGRLTHHSIWPLTVLDHLLHLLHLRVDVCPLGMAGCIAKLLRHIRLAAGHRPCGLLEILLDLGKLVTESGLLARHLLRGLLIRFSAPEGLLHLPFKILLLACQALCLVGEIAHLASRLLLLHVLQLLVGLLHGVRRALRIGRGLGCILLTAGCRVAHRTLGLLNLPHDLIQLAVLALAQAVLAVAGQILLALLTLLALLLPLLALLALSALLTLLLALLALLATGLLLALLTLLACC